MPVRFGRLVVALGMFLWCPRALACSCDYPPTATEALARVDQVFTARVLRVRTPWGALLPSDVVLRLPRFLRPERGRVAELEVTGVFKGPRHARRSLITGFGGGDCGLPVSEGEEWLMFAWSDGKTIGSGICSGSGPTSGKARALAELGRPERPEPASRVGLAALATTLAPLVVALGLGAHTLRRRTKKRAASA